jgi:hypothetical protein
LEESGVEEAGGGRKRKRKREPAGNPCILAGSVSVSGQRSEGAWVSARDPTFRFRFDLNDVIESVSRSHRPSQSPVGVRRRRTRGRDEMRSRFEREIVFEGRLLG